MTTSQPDRARTGTVQLASGITVPVVVLTNLRQRRVQGMPPIILAVPVPGYGQRPARQHHKRQAQPSIRDLVNDPSNGRTAPRTLSLTHEGAWLAPRS